MIQTVNAFECEAGVFKTEKEARKAMIRLETKRYFKNLYPGYYMPDLAACTSYIPEYIDDLVEHLKGKGLI